MGMFLNSVEPLANFQRARENPYFVDKSGFLEELLEVAQANPYICVTRPRRFGKTVMANLVASFLGKPDSGSAFEGCRAAASPLLEQYRNRYNLVFIDFSRVPGSCETYEAYMERIVAGLKRDLSEAYPEVRPEEKMALWDVLAEIFAKTGETFVFVLDEWDAVFFMPFVTEEEKGKFLLFLKTLLKDQAYVKLAYMTGILPIAKYSDGSELNMFWEYSMVGKERFGEYFGFTEAEVDMLFARYEQRTKRRQVTREGLRKWYDGYFTASGERVYNPRSVVCALTDDQLSNYWTSSGIYDSAFFYIRHNIDDVRDDLALMISGEAVPARVQEYAASARELGTRDEIYSAMVVYGLLTYREGYVSIPNQELMEVLREKSAKIYTEAGLT